MIRPATSRARKKKADTLPHPRDRSPSFSSHDFGLAARVRPRTQKAVSQVVFPTKACRRSPFAGSVSECLLGGARTG